MANTPPKVSRVTTGDSHSSVVLNHRESLAMPKATKSSAANQPADAHRDSVPYPNIPFHEDDETHHYHGWMKQFCVESSCDATALALAIFVPCVLYGKIEWRKARLSRGQPADDSVWKSKDGCNGMCWAYCLVGFFCPGVETIFVCITRSAVRGKYGIKGNIGTDCVLSYFCRPCTLVHMDREIRAREGDVKFRDSKKYAEYVRQRGIQTEQPTPHPPMEYMSPRPTHDQPSGRNPPRYSEMSQTGAGPFIIPPSKSAEKMPALSNSASEDPHSKTSKVVEKKPARPRKGHRRSKLSSAYLTPSDDDGEELLPLEPTKGKQSSIYADENESGPSSSGPRRNDCVSFERCQKREKGVLPPHLLENCEVASVNAPSAQHDLGNCGKSDQPTRSAHRLGSKICETLREDNDRAGSSAAKRSQHPLTQCENAGKEDDPASQHALEDCQSTATMTASKQQHELEKCEMTIKNSPREQHELEHYQTATRYAPHMQHGLERRDTTTSNSPQEQHKLEQCRIIASSPQRQQHEPEKCHTTSGDTPHKQHGLELCDTTTSNSPQEQHKLEQCRIIASSPQRQQHELEKCHTTSGDTPQKQHGLENCEMSDRMASQKQHQLEQCRKTSSNTSNVRQEQHGLEQCKITDANASTKQHKIEKCVESLPEMVFSPTLLACDLPPAPSIAKNHTLTVCEDSNGMKSKADNSPLRRNPNFQHKLADCSFENPSSTSGRLYQTVPNHINGERCSRSYAHRLSSCPVSSDDSSPDDHKAKYHVAENAETRNSTENSSALSEVVGPIRQEEMRKTRKEIPQLVSSQTMPTMSTSGTDTQRQELQPDDTAKGKRRVNEAKAVIDEYRSAEHSAQLSLAKFLESKGKTIGHGSSSNQGFVEAAARTGRRTRSDYGLADDSDDDASLEASGKVPGGENYQTARSTWLTRISSPFRGKE
ncbi:hypothetical protein HYALB_00002348 [Hymenoscyphus albidus]|uniref:Uncharacterized protein n=1 Tax=Hymenoscyphus albidus TaxID=595503 RepID=A0A9N9LIG0_9HELO|nr:hypothetical protein HYALB_00002348 [Hymenoscyphus albidus]